MKKLLILFIPLLFVFAGCEKNPIGALLYNGVDQSTGWPSVWTLYRNGNLMVSKNSYDIHTFTDYWSDRKNQLNLVNYGQSRTGNRAIYMEWDGSPSFDFKSGVRQTGYVGFWIYTENRSVGITLYTNPDAVPPEVLVPAYNKMKFWVKGKLNYGVVLRVETAGAASTDVSGAPGVWESDPDIVDNVWREYSVDIKEFMYVKEAFKIILRNTKSLQSNGGYVYIDDIRFTQ
ncbi:MAG: hypothetical protein FWF00_05775 [Endomicrobia bacterium]|nr:hypothetical protein [Endomicrobiia bacterium]MCL2507177.1 hypothetical protein [Endomicrobiia bacterium]